MFFYQLTSIFTCHPIIDKRYQILINVTRKPLCLFFMVHSCSPFPQKQLFPACFGAGCTMYDRACHNKPSCSFSQCFVRKSSVLAEDSLMPTAFAISANVYPCARIHTTS